MALILVGGLILIFLGMVSLYPPFIKALIKFRNNAQGVKTNITKTTISLSQITGIFAVIFGIALIFLFLLIRPKPNVFKNYTPLPVPSVTSSTQ